MEPGRWPQYRYTTTTSPYQYPGTHHHTDAVPGRRNSTATTRATAVLGGSPGFFWFQWGGQQTRPCRKMTKKSWKFSKNTKVIDFITTLSNLNLTFLTKQWISWLLDKTVNFLTFYTKLWKRGSIHYAEMSKLSKRSKLTKQCIRQCAISPSQSGHNQVTNWLSHLLSKCLIWSKCFQIRSQSGHTFPSETFWSFDDAKPDISENFMNFHEF